MESSTSPPPTSGMEVGGEATVDYVGLAVLFFLRPSSIGFISIGSNETVLTAVDSGNKVSEDKFDILMIGSRNEVLILPQVRLCLQA